MAKVAFMTLGCKVNQYETESMMAQFDARGYETVAFGEMSDVYIINTCTVTNMADKKSRQMLSKAKKMNPQGLVVAVGCYVQASAEALEKAEQVDLLVGNTDKGRIVDIVEEFLTDQTRPKVADLTKYRTYDDMWLTHVSGHTRAHIKIQDGCDQFCSYCIIPYARGRIRSREPASIIEEVTGLAAMGYKEIVLTGIHIASYGLQFEDYLLIDLLEDLDQITGIDRVRLGSVEPTLIDDDFVARLAGLRKICDHFHLSMQSGCDEVLSSMNRKYTTGEYYEAVERLRQAFPRAGFTTDLIVGFPGENDDHFRSTISFLEKVGFSDVHVFKYSMRDGTKAAKMSNQIDGTVKNSRSSLAMSVAENLKTNFGQSFIDDTLDVLVEEEQTIDGVCYEIGHTSNYLKVYRPVKASGKSHKNQLVEVRIVRAYRDGYIGM